MPYVLFGLAVFGLITSTVFAGIVLWAVPGYLRERRTALVQLAARPGFTPPLSLLKPLHGTDPGLESYLETFFTQDYPEYEILFCARDANDRRPRHRPPRRRASSAHPSQISFHRRAARLHQRQSHLHGENGGRSRARHLRHQRQRCSRLAGLSPRRGPSLRRPSRRRHVLPLSRRRRGRWPLGAT